LAWLNLPYSSNQIVRVRHIEKKGTRAMQATKSGRRLVPDAEVCSRYGIHVSTLRNWDLNAALNFPKPIRINNRKFRDEAELAQFDRTRAAEREAAA
jgi:predicted DNA-binding transcriptional regulator AlpA